MSGASGIDAVMARAAAAAAAVLLFACQPHDQHPVTVTQAAKAPPTAPAVPARDEDEDWGPPAEQAAIPADLASHPEKLRGLPANLIRTALGGPGLRRRESGAEVWQYHGEGCILDLFLYPEDGVHRVLHYQIRNREAEAANEGCFRGMLGARQAMLR